MGRADASVCWLARRGGPLGVVVLEHFAGLGLGDRLPTLPGDVEDDERDHEADDRVGEVCAPSATTAALASTPRLTKPSTRACLPSATSGGALRGDGRRARRTCAAISLPMKPITPAAASSQRWESCCGWMKRSIVWAERDAGREMKMAAHDREPGELFAAKAAQEEGEPERDRGERVAEVVDQVGEEGDAERARVDGNACATAVTVRMARLQETARMPARERRIERSTRPCECSCSSWSWLVVVVVVPLGDASGQRLQLVGFVVLAEHGSVG